MARIEIREACFVNGDPVDVGGEVTVDDATAKLLILSGRAVPATVNPQPTEDPAPAPVPAPATAPRHRLRTAQPTPDKED